MFGLVAVATGLTILIGGPEASVDGADLGASLDSELRFFVASWIGLGAFGLVGATRGEIPAWALAAITGVLFLGGIGRLISVVTDGRPHTLFLVLMVVELGSPAALLLQRGRPKAGS